MAYFTSGNIFGGRRRQKSLDNEIVAPEPHYPPAAVLSGKGKRVGAIIMNNDDEEESAPPQSLPPGVEESSSYKNRMSLFVQTCSPRTPRTPHDHDWDAEARELFLRLNIENLSEQRRHKYRNLDAVYAHPKTNAKLYIGNQTAARSESVLIGENIFDIVNCQDEHSTNFFENDTRFRYCRFPVSKWFRYVENIDSHDDILHFFENGCHIWIENALANGRNVLVHCLAGAHRAGTVGVSMMMRQGHFDVQTAIRLAKFQRPIVDPFGPLLDLLNRLQAAYQARGDALFTATSRPSSNKTSLIKGAPYSWPSSSLPPALHDDQNQPSSNNPTPPPTSKTTSHGRHISFATDYAHDIISPAASLKARKAGSCSGNPF
uniref:protein-tyrosine-phosphatase n=1 Tax=Aureoumbra lagunensis TaxID=44058 RepID=A0A7S3K2Z8_9STRA|mmetsp:Transcript_19243/g.24977  ORF Transcript_19243/g.24977 Transcript_19243/m.24977 type:complete len:375 (+) Transcript_19243:58-1182(+)